MWIWLVDALGSNDFKSGVGMICAIQLEELATINYLWKILQCEKLHCSNDFFHDKFICVDLTKTYYEYNL